MTEISLRAYADDDLALTLALETDPVAMAELGGPRREDDLRAVHRRRLADPWWLVVADARSGDPLGTIGIWETEHDGVRLHETGWMVLPAAQGRGVASAALTTLLDRARADGRFDAVHAFPGVTNAPSNRLCARFGFTLLGAAGFTFAGRRLQCNHWRLTLARR